MCRIAAFPPNFPREKAIEILENFENNNTDGTGSAYLKNGEFIVQKWPKPLEWAVKNRRFLSHMPYNNGWTIVHLRSASHGKNTVDNTHPFVIGPWAFIHNGIWSEYKLVKLALSKTTKFFGETDSEVAGNFWNIIGPKKFTKVIDYSGVFMGLNKNGHLWVSKTSGELVIKALSHQQILLASELDSEKFDGMVDALSGWYHFSPEGKYIKHQENITRWASGYPYRGPSSMTYSRSSIVDEYNHGFGGGSWDGD